MPASTLLPSTETPQEPGQSGFVLHDPARAALVASVSHELRSPLAVILGYGYTLLDGTNRDSKEERELLGIIVASAERLTTLVDDLLDVAKLDAGMFPLEREAVRVERIAERVLAHRRALYPALDLRLEVEGVPSLVSADPTRLEQVITNLVENAIKYSPAGRRVCVRVLAGDPITVEVCDDGEGIEPTEITRLFEPFFRGAGHRRSGNGAGLGLFICRRIVEAHGGRIWVESAPGCGTRVSFTVPCNAP